MKAQLKISHQEIVAYLHGNINQERWEEILKVREEDPVYEFLFNLIDELKSKVTIKEQLASNADVLLTFSALDDLLMRTFAGITEPTDAQQFIDGLMFSPLFYQRLIIKLSTVTPEIVLDEVPEMAQIKVKSDEEILSQVVAQVKGDEPSAEIEPYSKPIRIWDKIREFPLLPPTLVPRLPYAFATLLFLTLGVFWGVRFYNTSYRIHKAEKLLIENHRIYMAETPRLSGGYASTGIGMLMAGDEPRDYLTQAFDFTEQAIENGSKSPKAKQLQAQILIIQNDYPKADSVLNQIDYKARNSATVLNDLGVLKFRQEDWEAAAQYFESATHTDPKFIEAYYNLALAQDKLGQKQEAISTLNEYLKFKNDIEWKNAALSFLQKLQNREE